MKPPPLAVIILVILGFVALTYQGITYTAREETIDLAPVQITAERTRTIPLAPVLGVIALAGGAALFFVARRQA